MSATDINKEYPLETKGPRFGIKRPKARSDKQGEMPDGERIEIALRWQGANMYGQPLPFKVMHISEYLAENLNNGRLKVKRVGGSVTFHDPCQISRRGGATRAPRDVLKALGVELREMSPGGDLNWCCGGGGGVVTIHRADDLRYKVFEIKMKQVNGTGAEMLLMSCSNCRQTFDDGQAHFKWDKIANSLLETVADNLVE